MLNIYRTWSGIRPPVVLTGVLLIMGTYGLLHSWPNILSYLPKVNAQQQTTASPTPKTFVESRGSKKQNLSVEQLGALASKNASGWFSKTCDPTRKLRQVSFSTAFGNLSFYVYNSAREDDTFTKQALEGWYFEQKEMTRFLRLSRHLPLIDIGGNLGLCTLQAALQGRQVVAIEPIPENALRLCRSVTDFGHSSLVHVIQNAASSQEGNLTLAMDRPKGRARYRVAQGKRSGYDATAVYSIKLDSLLELLPFRRAALKMDVEGHEGRVLAGAERFFLEMDIPVIWMEWGGVRRRADHGAAYVVDFMYSHHMQAYHLMTGRRLATYNFRNWPGTVLWRKVK